MDPTMEEITDESPSYTVDIPLVILYSLGALTSAVLAHYAFRIYKLDFALQKKKGKQSLVWRTLIAAIIACIIWTVDSGTGLVVYGLTVDSGLLSDIFLIVRSLGVGLSFYLLFTVTVLTCEAMALAEGGIAATRNIWLMRLHKYTGWSLLTAVVGLIPLIVISVDIAFYVTGGICFGAAILYGILSYRFFNLSREWNEGCKVTEHQRIPFRCREIYHLAMIITLCMILLAMLFVALALVDDQQIMPLSLVAAERFKGFVKWGISRLFSALIFVTLRDLSHIPRRIKKPTVKQAAISSPPSIPNAQGSTEQVTGIDITNADNQTIGVAPHAPRPSWLPTTGVGQANVLQHCWSISLKNWIKFVHACMETDAWQVLVSTKGEKNINMYDVNNHFVTPWTSGTGCSIAVLMNGSQGPVDVMISHAWAGSVRETLRAMKSLTTVFLLPLETNIFFCTTCIYQPGDDATGGLSISEQLRLKPFAKIIALEPEYGMFVVHTTISEIFERLWCVHEVDECVEAKIKIFALFDSGSWNDESLQNAITSISTRDANCNESDKVMLTCLINARGGFDRLDEIIREFRQQAIKDLAKANLFQQWFGVCISAIDVKETHKDHIGNFQEILV